MKIASPLDAVGARLSRRDVLIAGAALVTAPFVQSQTAAAQGGQTPAPAVGRTTGWASYGGDKASTKDSTLAQIDRDNFSRLRVAWTWQSAEADVVTANPAVAHMGVGVDTAHGRRRPVRQHLALASGGDRRRDRQDEVGLRPRDVEERHAVQQRLRAPRGRLLGGWQRSAHPLRDGRRLPDLPERADRQASCRHSARTGASI